MNNITDSGVVRLDHDYCSVNSSSVGTGPSERSNNGEYERRCSLFRERESDDERLFHCCYTQRYTKNSLRLRRISISRVL